MLTVTVQGRVDGTNAQAFDTELSGLIDEADTALILDLSGLNYMSSAGLRTVLMTAKRMQTQRTKFALCSLQPSIKEIMQIAGFDRIITVVDSHADALAQVTGS